MASLNSVTGNRAAPGDLLELFERLDHGLFGHRRLDSAARDQYRAPERPIYDGHVAVAVPLVLAQVHVEPRGELPAEYVVQQVQREVGRVFPGDGQMARADHGLGRSGLVG